MTDEDAREEWIKRRDLLESRMKRRSLPPEEYHSLRIELAQIEQIIADLKSPAGRKLPQR